MQNEEYLKDLAQKLRWRHLDESEVADTLREVASETAVSGRDAEDAFGPVETYAEKFDRGRAKSAGYMLATVGALLITLGVAVHVVSISLGVIDPSLPQMLLTYGGAFVAMIALIIIGARIDRRLPASLAT